MVTVTDEETTWPVRGRIALPPEIQRARARSVVVQVQDVSRMDAPSTVVAEQRMDDVDLEESGEVPFEVEVPAGLVDRRKRYAMRVHVDLTGTGDVTKGDYVSTASYEVLRSPEDDRELLITVRRV